MNEHEAKPIKSIETNQYHSGKGQGAAPKLMSKVTTSTKRKNGKMPRK